MVKHGHPSMEAGLGRGILRGVVLIAPPGSPGGAMERTRGGESGPDPSQQKGESFHEECSKCTSKEEGISWAIHSWEVPEESIACAFTVNTTDKPWRCLCTERHVFSQEHVELLYTL